MEEGAHKDERTRSIPKGPEIACYIKNCDKNQ